MYFAFLLFFICSGWVRIAGSFLVSKSDPRQWRSWRPQETSRFDERRFYWRWRNFGPVAACGPSACCTRRTGNAGATTRGDPNRKQEVASARLEAAAGEHGRGRRHGSYRRCVLMDLSVYRWATRAQVQRTSAVHFHKRRSIDQDEIRSIRSIREIETKDKQ